MTSRSLEALRRLLLVTAAVCLLGTGGVDLVRAPVGASAAGAAAGAVAGSVAGSGAGTEPVPPATVSALRSALAAATPLLGGDLAPPAAGPVLHLDAVGGGDAPDAGRRAPGTTARAVDGRGPPLTAGT